MFLAKIVAAMLEGLKCWELNCLPLDWSKSKIMD